MKKREFFKHLEGYLNLIWSGKIPRDINSLDKLKCDLDFGKRLYWYYQEDLDFFLDENKNHNGDDTFYPPFSGIIIPYEDQTVNDEFAIIIMEDIYPIEKENCKATWFPLYQLLDNDDLVEINDKEKLSIKELRKKK